MGLYLCIFEGDVELEGVEIGPYAEFDEFRLAVAAHVEGGTVGAICPVLMLHSDCDGQWSPGEAVRLRAELSLIADKFLELPPEPLETDCRREVAKMYRLKPKNLYECFFDVDGEPLIERLIEMTKISEVRKQPILFQ